mmetsp:Transcript_47665/g.102077  ORF Transcript_47665/g.102077 Transcript_47665/m.102077 type:complete len:90 (-) Transcript_47665:336-605(-)
MQRCLLRHVFGKSGDDRRSALRASELNILERLEQQRQIPFEHLSLLLLMDADEVVCAASRCDGQTDGHVEAATLMRQFLRFKRRWSQEA